jgi:hypothetical protein
MFHAATLLCSVGILLPAASPATMPADGGAAVHNVLSDAERAAGFRLLFNGHDLENWVHNGKPGSFVVKDGMICGDRTGHTDLAYWLSTERQYRDFEIRLQYRIGRGGNSGVFLRAPREGRASKLGMEIQILDDGGKPGKPAVNSTAAIYQVVAPASYASRPAGEWNDLWICCAGDRIRVTLNGKLVTDADIRQNRELQSRSRVGYIGVSAHTGPVQFRDIRLKEIVAAASAPATSPSPSVR